MTAFTSVLVAEEMVWCVSCVPFSIRAKIRRSGVILKGHIRHRSGLLSLAKSEMNGVLPYLCCFEVWSRPTRSIRSSSRCRWCACSVPAPHTPGTCPTLRPPPTAPALDSGPAGMTFFLTYLALIYIKENKITISSVEYTSVSSLYALHQKQREKMISPCFSSSSE